MNEYNNSFPVVAQLFSCTMQSVSIKFITVHCLLPEDILTESLFDFALLEKIAVKYSEVLCPAIYTHHG